MTGPVGAWHWAIRDRIQRTWRRCSGESKRVPTKVKENLHAHLDKPPYTLEMSCHSAIGKLNYAGQTSRPEIMYTVHQLAKYSSNPREPHSEALLYLIRYLKLTRDISLRFLPIPIMDLIVMRMLISLAIGIKLLLHMIQVLQSLAAAGLFSMLAVLSFRHRNFSQWLPCLRLRPNTSRYHRRSATYFPSCFSFKKLKR